MGSVRQQTDRQRGAEEREGRRGGRGGEARGEGKSDLSPGHAGREKDPAYAKLATERADESSRAWLFEVPCVVRLPTLASRGGRS